MNLELYFWEWIRHSLWPPFLSSITSKFTTANKVEFQIPVNGGFGNTPDCNPFVLNGTLSWNSRAIFSFCAAVMPPAQLRHTAQCSTVLVAARSAHTHWAGNSLSHLDDLGLVETVDRFGGYVFVTAAEPFDSALSNGDTIFTYIEADNPAIALLIGEQGAVACSIALLRQGRQNLRRRFGTHQAT